jgi:hypothetical protein
MKLNEFKSILKTQDELHFQLQNGEKVPAHFHITEVGLVSKHFVDCGGTVRLEKKINFQLWTSVDFYHRLKVEKLLNIIDQSASLIENEDYEIELEYQQTSITKFGVAFENNQFILTNLQTACLAEDTCGVTPEKIKVTLEELKEKASSSCTPGGGCC